MTPGRANGVPCYRSKTEGCGQKTSTLPGRVPRSVERKTSGGRARGLVDPVGPALLGGAGERGPLDLLEADREVLVGRPDVPLRRAGNRVVRDPHLREAEFH